MKYKIASLPFVICILVCILLFEMMEMFPADNTFSYSLYLLVPIALASCSGLFLLNNPLRQSLGPLKYLIFYLILSYVLSILHGGYRTNAQYITFLIPIFLLYVSYSIELKNIAGNSYHYLLLFLFLSLLVYYFLNFQKNYVLDFEYQDNAAYTLFYFLPIVLCIEKQYLKILGIFAIFIALLFSLKRGGLLAFALSVFVYYLVANLSSGNKRSKIRLFIGTIIILSIIIYVFNYVDAISGNAISIRFQSIEEDQGSGRLDIWNWIISSYDNNLLAFSTFGGHGWNAVYEDSGLRSAHNDFLEILYDFGIFALAIYIIFFIYMIKYAIQLVKLKSYYAAPLFASIIMVLTNSMVSHIITYPKYMVIYTLSIGFLYAASRKEIVK